MTDRTDTRRRAAAFHRLHADAARPLRLANAWDAGSARLLEQAGAPAVATSSAAMAWCAGYADGEQLPAAELLAACARIARVLRVPLTVDIERGHGRSAAEVGQLGAALIEIGAVGVNIEDGLAPDGRPADPQPLCERIVALREAGERAGVPLFVNARTDVYLAKDMAPAQRLADTLRRARLYLAAGADGLFVPGLAEPDAIGQVAGALAGKPLNIYAGYPGAPAVAARAAAGTRRISLGCGPLQAAYGLLGRIQQELADEGRYDTMAGLMRPAAEINRLFAD